MKGITLGITGASGIIGSKLCKNLLESGYVIHILTRNPDNFKKGPKVKFFKIDLLNPDKNILADFIKSIKFLFHLASELNDESKMMKTNYHGTRILVDSIKNKSIPFIYLSSIGVFDFVKSKQINENSYKKQLNIYEKTKFLSEQYIFKSQKKDNTKFIILRPSIILDFKMKSKIIDYLIILTRFGIKIKFSKKIIANFVLLDDVVKIISKIFEKEKASCQSYNISSDILLEDFLFKTSDVIKRKTYINLSFNFFFKLIDLSILFRLLKKNNDIKRFFNNTCKISCQKIESLMGEKLSSDYYNFLNDYTKNRR